MSKRTLTCLLLLFTVAGLSCNHRPQQAVIAGNFTGEADELEGRMLYLYDQAKREVPRDSCLIKKGKFHFIIDADSNFQPFQAMLRFDDTDGNKIFRRPLGFVNPQYDRTTESVFYVDHGLTRIEGESRRQGRFLITEGSPENDPFYKHISIRLPHDGGPLTEEDRAYDSSLIGQYPYSQYLLWLFYINRPSFVRSDLASLLPLFDEQVQKRKLHRLMSAYVKSNDKDVRKFPNDIVLHNQENKDALIVDDSAGLNLVVFWASWCGPCRKDIPSLKQLYAKYQSRGLHISSISIDNDSASWVKAVRQEKMPWQQFIIGDSHKDSMDFRFGLKSIPICFLYDKNHTLIAQYLGFDSTISARLTATISQQLQ